MQSQIMTQRKNPPITPPQSSYATCSDSRPSTASVLDNLLISDNGFYAATPRLTSRDEYFAGGQKANILIAIGKDDEEFIIGGVFQITSISRLIPTLILRTYFKATLQTLN
ncbi:hypothetical protein K503DRAFT_869879 [Rhizopogon vinicolor AM-OR11-026]|uniref:Uncharacterized protein n=1 Tax=Rhizopogon vinicolor AM-OR11-026 TaxID=1314800 RepID=A0A1B7MJZ0_9AGAM|nr:hypothetical protein K503DRAFT_869879 [Rhizopogon vinicolor AM-OR11-026]